jgi:hypothetical protein
MHLTEVFEVSLQENFRLRIVYFSLIKLIQLLENIAGVFEAHCVKSADVKVGLCHAIELILIFFEQVATFFCQGVF